MGVVRGAISITDNMSAVLRSIKAEQSSFRQDVERTKKTLQSTWDKKRTARLDATAAKKAADTLSKKLEPLKKKVTTAVAIKDLATAKVTAIKNKVKAIGQMAASPIIKLKDGVSAGLSKIKSGLASIAKSVSIPVSVAATAVVEGAINEGAKLQQSIGGVDTLFKDNASVVKANADAAFKTAGLSANAYMEQVTSFSASLLNSMSGDTAKAAAVADMAMVDMADNANKFGTDMGSIQNAYQGFAKQNYTMLDNLKLGYGGTKEEMQRLLKDAQKLTGVKYDIDNLSDVYSAIHAIQDELGVTGTTAKEASQTFSGSFAAMKAAAQNVLGNLAIGGDVTGATEALVDSALTFVSGNLIPMVANIFTSLPGAIKTGLSKAAPQIKSALKASLPPSVFNFGSSLIGAFKGIVPAVQSMVNGVGPVISTFSGIFTAAIPVVEGIISGLSSFIQGVMPVVSGVFETVGGVIQNVLSVIGNHMGLFQGVVGSAVNVVTTVWNTLGPTISTVCSVVLSVVDGLLTGIEAVFNFLAPYIQQIWTSISGFFTEASTAISSVCTMLGDIFNSLYNAVASAFDSISSKVSSVISAVTGWISGAVSTISGFVGAIGNAISAVGNFIGGGGGGVGRNAEGTNNWRGGPTWVGERGPELVELPRGSRVLPNKESVQVAQSAARPVMREVVQHTVEKPSIYAVEGGGSASILVRIEKALGVITNLMGGKGQNGGTPEQTPTRPDNGPDFQPPTYPTYPAPRPTAPSQATITVTIAKLADEIIVREDADIDRIGEAIAKRVILAAQNMVPV